jgi:hypothetical protein
MCGRAVIDVCCVGKPRRRLTGQAPGFGRRTTQMMNEILLFLGGVLVGIALTLALGLCGMSRRNSEEERDR